MNGNNMMSGGFSCVNHTMDEVVQFVKENDVKFIRLAFCDIFGQQKNIAIQPCELTHAFEQGFPFNASSLRGFLNVEDSDLLLFPDPSTMAILPWRPTQARVLRFYCDIRYPNGKPFEGDGRQLLREAIKRARNAGYSFTIGTASEFYLFNLDEKGNPDFSCPCDKGGYFDVSPLDKAENVRREICLTLEEMGIQPESSHHEKGPGQNEVDFRCADPLEAADNFITFKWVVKSMAVSKGLHATFLPKPLEKRPGSGLHLSISIYRDGQNLFYPLFETSADGKSFVAGILHYAADITVFGNPLANSYVRLGEFAAPRYITWSHKNRAPFIIIPLTDQSRCSRMKIRSLDGCMNPYIVFALLIHAGLDGIAQHLELPAACDDNLFTASPEIQNRCAALPESLLAALLAAKNSAFIQRNLPREIRDVFFAAKQEEYDCKKTNRLYFCQDFERY